MSTDWNIEEADRLWGEFLRRWPLETLGSLELKDYARAGDGDCFVNWLEARTERLGSIWGGSAFKFGIYHREDSQPKTSERGRVFGAEYAWYAKYGGTPEEAFANVRAQVVKVAQASRSSDFATVEAADLGEAVKWKIAFLYQDRVRPSLLPIYNIELLRAALGPDGRGLSFYELNRALMQRRGDVPLFQFAWQLWTQGREALSKRLNRDEALAFLSKRLRPIKDPVQYLAGFETKAGRQLALVRTGEEMSVFVEPGDWPRLVPDVTLKKAYGKDEPRRHSLKANAPRLAQGNPAYQLTVPTMAALASLCDAYDDEPLGAESRPAAAPPNESSTEARPGMSKSRLNRILYGPPGTGKTFRTAQIAVEICDGKADMPRDQLMQRYEALRKERRISFVTFHQSYGYEDFVEGLRPEPQNGQVHYPIRPGIFREVCDAARRSTVVEPGLTGKPLSERTIYKMSLGVAGTRDGNLVFNECITNGYVLLGYGDDVDFSECQTGEDIRKKVSEVPGQFDRPDSHARYVTTFKLDMQIGDIVIVSQGNAAFRAIGEVVGDYEFLEAAPAGTYHQMRPVRWLAVFEANRPVSEISGRSFTQSTLNRPDPSALKLPVIESLINQRRSASNAPFVLIIDEINRANISKVLGELITLLEPDKREGEENALTVKLPYSGDDFSVPSNLYVVGTMNSADRSIALMDTALRRRFEFEEMQPDYGALPSEGVEGIDLGRMLRALNDRIEYLDERDHAIGHAYFINVKTLDDLDAVFRRKVIPLLQEYFYEDLAKVVLVLNDQAGNFIEQSNGTPFGLEAVADEADPKVRYRVRDSRFSLGAYRRLYS